jgi:uncharacterized protein YkwD
MNTLLRRALQRRLREALGLALLGGLGVAAAAGVGRAIEATAPTRRVLWVPSDEAHVPRELVAPASSAPGLRPASPPASEEVLLERLWQAIDEARAEGARCGSREVAPARPLEVSEALDEAAWLQAAWMAEADDWAHVTPGNPAGSDPSERAWNAGYDGRVRGEVLAWGQRTPRAAVEWWLQSPPHCRALLDPDADHGGIAVTDDPHSSGRVWVAVLGRGG